MKAFRKQFVILSDLMAISSNRLAIASHLFSEELIPFNCYKDIADNSSKTDQEKGTALMIALMTSISSQPELLERLIDVLKRLEPFQQIAHKLEKDIYH